MKTLQLAEAMLYFPELLRDIEAGNDIAIEYGKKKQEKAVIISYEKWGKKTKRQLGTLEGRMSVEFADDFAMSDEELTKL
jgi:hypothetical protein